MVQGRRKPWRFHGYTLSGSFVNACLDHKSDSATDERLSHFQDVPTDRGREAVEAPIRRSPASSPDARGKRLSARPAQPALASLPPAALDLGSFCVPVDGVQTDTRCQTRHGGLPTWSPGR